MTTDEWIKAHIEELTNDGPTHEVHHIELDYEERFRLNWNKVATPNGPQGFWLPPIFGDDHDSFESVYCYGHQFMAGLLRSIAKQERDLGIPQGQSAWAETDRFMKDMIIADLAELPMNDLDSFAHAMCRIADCRLIVETQGAELIDGLCELFQTPMLIQPVVVAAIGACPTLDRFRTSQLVIAFYEEG